MIDQWTITGRKYYYLFYLCSYSRPAFCKELSTMNLSRDRSYFSNFYSFLCLSLLPRPDYYIYPQLEPSNRWRVQGVVRVACVCFVKRGLMGAAPKNPCVTSCGFGGATSNPRRGGVIRHLYGILTVMMWHVRFWEDCVPGLVRILVCMYNTYVEVELIVCMYITYHSLLRSCGLVTWNGGRDGVLIRCTV